MSEPLATVVRRVVHELEKGSPDVARIAVEPLRARVAANVHVGKGSMTSAEIVEWYAGQILDVVDREAWFAMNSILNCLDRFVPAPEVSDA